MLLQRSLNNGGDLGIVFPIREEKTVRAQGELLQRVNRWLKDGMKCQGWGISEVGSERIPCRPWKTADQHCDCIPPKSVRKVGQGFFRSKCLEIQKSVRAK